MKLFAKVGDYPVVTNIDICDFHASPYCDTDSVVSNYNGKLERDSKGKINLYAYAPWLNESFTGSPLAVEYVPIRYSTSIGDWVATAPKDDEKAIDFGDLAAVLSRACATNYVTSSSGPDDDKGLLSQRKADEVSLTEIGAWDVAERVYSNLKDVVETAKIRGNDGLNERHTLRYGVYVMADAEKYVSTVAASVAAHMQHELFIKSNDVPAHDHEDDMAKFRKDPLGNAQNFLALLDAHIEALKTTPINRDGDSRNTWISDVLWHKQMVNYMLDIANSKDHYAELQGRVGFVYCQGMDGKPSLFINTLLAPFAFTSHTNMLTGTALKALIEARSTHRSCSDTYCDEAFTKSEHDSFIDLKTFLRSTHLEKDVSGLILYPALLLPRVSTEQFASALPKAYARSLVMADYVSKSKYFRLTPDATLTDDWQNYRTINRLGPITSLQAHKAAELFDCIGYMFAKVTIDSQDYFNWSIFDIVGALQGTTALKAWETPPTDVQIHYSCAQKGAEATLTITVKGKTASVTINSGKFGEITADENYIEFVKFMRDYSNQAGTLLFKSDIAEPANTEKLALPGNIFFESAGISWCKMGRGAYLAALAWNGDYACD